MQFTAIMLMTLMTVALTVWMPQRLVEDRVANRSRWLLAAGLALIGVQFALQYAFNFREQGVTQAVFINLLFFIPCSTLISVSILNLQRQGRIRLWEYMTGPVAWIAAATLMITLGQMNGQPLMGDTPEMRNAEMIGSLCYTVMQIVFASLLLTELRRSRADGAGADGAGADICTEHPVGNICTDVLWRHLLPMAAVCGIYPHQCRQTYA